MFAVSAGEPECQDNLSSCPPHCCFGISFPLASWMLQHLLLPPFSTPPPKKGTVVKKELFPCLEGFSPELPLFPSPFPCLEDGSRPSPQPYLDPYLDPYPECALGVVVRFFGS